MRDFVLIAVIAVVSFGLRASFIVVAGDAALSPRFEHLLANLKPAAFAALAVAGLAAHDAVGAPYLAAAVAAGWTARRGNLAKALVAGMIVYYVASRFL